MTTKTTTKKTATAVAKGSKIRWTVGQTHNNGKDQAGLGLGGVAYALARNENGQYVATRKAQTGKAVELATGSFSQAYWAAVNDNKKAAESAAKRAAAGAARKAAAEAKKETAAQVA